MVSLASPSKSDNFCSERAAGNIGIIPLDKYRVEMRFLTALSKGESTSITSVGSAIWIWTFPVSPWVSTQIASSKSKDFLLSMVKPLTKGLAPKLDKLRILFVCASSDLVKYRWVLIMKLWLELLAY